MLLKTDTDLGEAEQAIVHFLQSLGGRYNRHALFVAGVPNQQGGHFPLSQVHDALDNLANTGLLTMDIRGLELVLDDDTLDIFRGLGENQTQYADLIKEAVGVQGNAWAPYSLFHVGAAILTTEGKVVTGTNFENASYGVTICAERGAIGSAVKEGALNPVEGKYIEAIAVVLPSDELGRPCGACRQAIYEFSKPDGDSLVVMANPQGEADVLKIKTLLPHAFGPFDLGMHVEEES